MSQQYKTCPICGTQAARGATVCDICGTTLEDVPLTDEDTQPVRLPTSAYERRYGETDLLEGELTRGRGTLLLGLLVVLLLVVCIGAFAFAGLQIFNPPAQAVALTPGGAAQDSAPLMLATNTPRPTLVLITVTPAPPSATPTPTQGPCTHQVQPGDDLISIAWNCGHRDWESILPVILEVNDLDAPELMQAGQTIIIPWPTPTPDPNAQPTPAPDAATPSGDAAASVAQAPTDTPSGPTVMPTETLLPGLMWHVVQPDESLASLVYQYDTSAQVLSEINPQIDFLQCDFGELLGGPRCTVLLQAGAQVRVPAPTPTPTLSPTLSGSETPTPTPTATFNAPSSLSPDNRALFRRDELVTLRWVTTGTLGAGETYRVRVRDLTVSTEFTADTNDLFFIIPEDWQGQDARRHEYEWTVSVITLDAPDSPIFTTPPRTFTWEGRGE